MAFTKSILVIFLCPATLAVADQHSRGIGALLGFEWVNRAFSLPLTAPLYGRPVEGTRRVILP
jgi:hypothetical protein